MSTLDPRTTMMLAAGLFILLPTGLVLAIAPKRKHFAWWWLGGSFCVAIGLLLVAGRDLLPTWITYHAANILIMCSFVLWHQSLRIIQSHPWRLSTLIGWFLLATITFIVFYESFETVTRTTLGRLILGTLCLSLAYSLWNLSKRQKGINVKLISISFLLTGLSLYVHAVLSSYGNNSGPFVKTWDGAMLSLFVLVTAVVSHLSFLGLTLDINTQQRLERRIDRLREQETLQLNQQINELERQTDLRMAASQLAHEVNQPLTAVMAMSEVCKQALKKPSIPIDKVLSNLDKTAFNIKRASDLLMSIRMDTADQSYKPQEFNLEEVIHISLEMLQTQIEKERVQVHLQLDASDNSVMGNPLYMTQVLTNLMRNAIEAMSSSPIRTLTVSTIKRGDRLDLSIEDSGPVMSDEHFRQMNQPFNSSKDQGLGIGLLICRSLLARQGYTLEMTVKSDGGLLTKISLHNPSVVTPSC